MSLNIHLLLYGFDCFSFLTFLQGANGSPGTSIKNINEVKKTSVSEEVFDGSRPRVFLLGENRWEEPSRLSGSSKVITKNTNTKQNSTNKCITCRGEGRLLCMGKIFIILFL